MYQKLEIVVQAVVILLVISLVAGQALGQPVGLAFVKTGSMAPTIQPGDGFIAMPTPFTDEIKEGDIIVFRAERLHGGGLTTHRVVDKTEKGYITRGDANPFTDQSGENEPPVKKAQVVAVAWRPGGTLLVIPHLGDAVGTIREAVGDTQRMLAGLFGTRALLGTQGLAYLFFSVSVMYYLLAEYRQRGRDTRSADRQVYREDALDSRLVVGAFTIVLIAGTTAPMVVPAGTQEYGVVSADFESSRPTVIPAGEFETITYVVDNGGFVPVVAYVEPASDGVRVDPQRHHLRHNETHNATITLQAPPETGYYRRYVVEHRYLALLPGPIIDDLHEAHPWAPIVVIDLLIGVPFYLIGIAIVGTGSVRSRKRDTDRPGEGLF